MNEQFSSLVIHFVNNLVCSYLPAMCILVPRRGKRYVNWLLFTSFYMVWVWISRYVVSFPTVLHVLICISGVMIVLLQILYIDSWKRKMKVLAYWLMIGLLGDLTGMLCMQFFIPGLAEVYFYAQVPVEAAMMSLMANLCCEIITMTGASVYLCLIRKRQRKLFGAFMLILIYQFVLGAGFFVLCNDFTERVAQIGFLLELSNLVLDVMMLYLLENILKKQDIEERVKEVEEMRRQEYAYFEAVSQSTEELRLVRHDFSNHLQAVYRMMEDQDSEDLVAEMLGEMWRRVES